MENFLAKLEIHFINETQEQLRELQNKLELVITIIIIIIIIIITESQERPTCVSSVVAV